MHLLTFLIQLGGAVALLLYATRMVRTGVQSAAGPRLNRLFLSAEANHLRSVGIGLSAAVLLQSSTAVALLSAEFAATGILTLTTALAIMLGADIGTALVVQFLSLEISALIPLLLLVGAFFYLKFQDRVFRQIGRAILGIAFILLSLVMIRQASEPVREFQYLPEVLAYLGSDFTVAFITGVVLAFAMHSSVATVLLIAALGAEGVLSLDAGLPMILGANVGGACVAVWLTRTNKLDARRIAIGNLLYRFTGAMLALLLIEFAMIDFAAIGSGPARQMVNFHLAFNIALLIVCLPFNGAASRMIEKIVLDPPGNGSDLDSPQSALDPAMLGNPKQALSNVVRELLRMSESIRAMFEPTLPLLSSFNKQRADHIEHMDMQVNKMHLDLKLYLAQISQNTLERDQGEAVVDFVDIAVALERAGDIILKEILPSIRDKDRLRRSFSANGLRELQELHTRVMQNIGLAQNVLVSEDPEIARQLVEEKEHVRQLERRSLDRHVERLAAETPESIETSDLHVDLLRAFKEINSCFVPIGYPILKRSGELRKSRLKKNREPE